MSGPKPISRTLFILVSFVFILSVDLSAQDRKSTYPFFIVQMTDPQFGFLDNKDFSGETVLYEKAVERINSIRPAFVVITGDFVHDKSNQAQWDEFDRITAKIDKTIPVWLSPGNHDIGQPPEKDDLEKYINKYGYDRFSFSIRKSSFIGLNTCLIKSGKNEAEQIQRDWLRKRLDDGKRARHIILFGHYPFFIKNPDEPETYSNIGPELREKYLNLFDKYNVTAVFSGHLHNNAGSFTGTTEMIVTSAVGRPLGDAPSGIRIIKVFKDRMTHKYYPLDEIP
ncbi:MAG TPA: metallophosphatase, partial [Bacteroidales bacterium]|nr:metallophosphatase [Bacteroidales bacterium]